MAHAVLVDENGVIIGGLNSVDAQNLPVAPSPNSFVVVTQAVYDTVIPNIKTDRGRYAFYYDAAEKTVKALQYQREPWSHYLIVRNDGFVSGARVAKGKITNFPAGRRLVEVDETTFYAVNAKVTHDGAPAWHVNAQNVPVPVADTRPILNVAQPSGQVAIAGTPFQISFALTNAGGDTLSVNGRRDISYVYNEKTTIVSLLLVNGTRNATPTLNEVGEYQIKSAAPTLYRVAGDAVIRVGVSW